MTYLVDGVVEVTAAGILSSPRLVQGQATPQLGNDGGLVVGFPGFGDGQGGARLYSRSYARGRSGAVAPWVYIYICVCIYMCVYIYGIK
jgi:hypothetical protein